MSDYPTFQRSPRVPGTLPEGEVEIPAPPQAPSEPSMSATSILFFMVPGLLSLLVIYFFARANGGSMTMMLYSLPMMAAGYLANIGQYWLQKRKYHGDLERREQKYRAALQQYREQLQRSRDQQRMTLCETDPDPAELSARVCRRDARMWERSPKDPDYLRVRLGVGKVSAGVTIKVPRPSSALDADTLFQEAQGLASEYGEVPGAPICLSLRDVGTAGVVGRRDDAINAMQSIVMQIATHHSPSEVKIAALFPAHEASEWAWMRWLPHVWSDDRQSRYMASDSEGADALLDHLYDLVNRRRNQLQVQAGSKVPPLPTVVLLIGDTDLMANEPVIPLIFREGPALGTCALILADRKEGLPMECRAFAQVGSGIGHLVQTAPTRLQADFLPDKAGSELGEQLAREMAPLRVHRLAAAAEIPGQVTLLETLGTHKVEEIDVLRGWAQNEPYRTLAVPIGFGAGDEKVSLDLHEKAHGPHGLVAGATGSGKSELLQTFIAALAVSFHPHEVALVIVDYKGGGMANAFQGLPHLTGTITNLEGSLARRALSALKAELKRRQRLLAEAGVNHVDAYLRIRRQDLSLQALPHLVIVVDEFAELKADQPDFMRELISAVRVGRSLGVHLILATQKPAGVVDDQIWSNTRFRLCLRVERPEDSQEVLRSPEAADITRAGRAYFQVGNHERFELFQAGWGGAPYNPDSDLTAERAPVAEVGLDGRRYHLREARAARLEARTSQLEALVEHLRAVARETGIEALPGPWLPPLPVAFALRDCLAEATCWDGTGWRGASRWLEPVIGLLDDPEQQWQGPLRLPLGKEGHLAIFGAPGNGKTTLLQTLLCSLALDHGPDQVQIYLLDGSGRSLTFFETLPHVGAVITLDEGERFRRLLRYLLQELDLRKELVANAGCSTLTDYRRAGQPEIPAIVLALDNLPAIVGAYPDEEEQLAQLAREGGSLGVHLVVTAGSPAAIRHRIAGNLSLAVTLTLADRGDYSSAVGRTGGLEPAPLPGRGLVKGNPPLEFQTALPAEGESEWERNAALRALFSRMDQAWTGTRPRPVAVLPEVVSLASLVAQTTCWEPAPGDLRATLGLEVESLEAFAVDLQEGPLFLVSGPPGSGKTTLLRTWTVALADRFDPESLHLYLIDPTGGDLAPLRRLPQVCRYCADSDAVDGLVEHLSAEMGRRRKVLEEARRTGTALVGEDEVAAACAPQVLVVDDFDMFRSLASDAAKEELERLVRRERGLGLYVLAAGSSGLFSQYSYEGLIKALKELQTGFVLGSNDHADLQLFNLRPLTGEPGRLLPGGLGYYTRRGRTRTLKVATLQAGTLQLVEWVDRISRRGTVTA